jgi:hypothetical protein
MILGHLCRIIAADLLPTRARRIAIGPHCEECAGPLVTDHDLATILPPRLMLAVVSLRDESVSSVGGTPLTRTGRNGENDPESEEPSGSTRPALFRHNPPRPRPGPILNRQMASHRLSSPNSMVHLPRAETPARRRIKYVLEGLQAWGVVTELAGCTIDVPDTIYRRCKRLSTASETGVPGEVSAITILTRGGRIPFTRPPRLSPEGTLRPTRLTSIRGHTQRRRQGSQRFVDHLPILSMKQARSFRFPDRIRGIPRQAEWP